MLPTATKSTTLVSLQTVKAWLGVKSAQTKSLSALTSVGTVATAVCTAHGYQTNQFVTIAGASPSPYNGGYLITVVDANTFTFPLSTSTSSPATGSPTVTPDDVRYAAMADAASEELEQQLGVPFVQRSIVERQSGMDKPVLILSQAPIASVSSVMIDGAAVDASRFLVEADPSLLTLTDGSVWNCGVRNVAVTYVAGYDVQDGAALPSDVVRACLDLAKAIHDELVTNAIAATSVNVGPMSMVIKPAKFPPSVQRVLDGWNGKGYRP